VRPGAGARWKLTGLALASTVALAWYLWWLLQPGRVGNPILFAVLVTAELFNVVQALGFWWTCALPRRRRLLPRPRPGRELPDVDVFIPTYNEPASIVEPTVAAATRLRGARVRVYLLDDGNRTEMERLAARWGARYVRRSVHSGAKAGNINHALARTDGAFVAVLDCDHVPHPDFLARTLGRFDDERVAFVQTPQYYANERENTIAAASWSQQALFFGPIAIGKDDHGSMFCCGTNVVFRRRALEAIGGFPENSLTEDFELSLHLHEGGWTSAYVPEVLASGLGPEDLASYVSQQHRWARGCVSAIPRVLRSRMPLRQKVQYLLSASYFLSGWTVLVYLSLPVIRSRPACNRSPAPAPTSSWRTSPGSSHSRS
jgi:cellulose synthase (UDP-forming)